MKTIRNVLIAVSLMVAGNMFVINAGNNPNGDNADKGKPESMINEEMITLKATKMLIAPNGIHIVYLNENKNNEVIAAFQKKPDGNLISIIDTQKNACYKNNFFDKTTGSLYEDVIKANLGFVAEDNSNSKKPEGFKSSVNKKIKSINESARTLIGNMITKNETGITIILGSVTTLTVAGLVYAGWKLTKSFKKEKDSVNSDQNDDVNEEVKSPVNA